MQTDEIRKWKRTAMKLLETLDQKDRTTRDRTSILMAVAQWEIALQLSLANRRGGISLERMRELLIHRVGVNRKQLDSTAKVLDELVTGMVPPAEVRKTKKLAEKTARKLKAAGEAAAKA